MAAAKQEVGYKNPPKHTQFKKGRSGNPGGRRHLKSGTFRDALAKVLERAYDADTGLTFRDEIAAELINQAVKGQSSSVAILLREFE